MKTNELLKKIIIISVFVLILSIIFAGVKDSISKKETNVVESYSPDQVEEIVIKTKSASIDIGISLDDEIHIYEKRKRQYHQVKRENDKLIISDMTNHHRNCFFFCSNKGLEYKIEIPRGYQKNISVIANVADIKIDHIQLNSLLLSNDVGDIEVSNVKVQKLEITSDVGDVSLEHIRALMMIQSNIGDIEVEDWFVTGNSKLQTDTGDIEVELSLENSCQIHASTSGGNVEAGSSHVLGNGDYTIDLKSSVGNIEYDLYH